MFLSDDDMVECPYNKTHRMLRKRLQSHLLKCRLNYPDVELRKCPFNITHLIPEPEFTHHATNCPDRKLITQYKYDAPEKQEEEGPKHAPIECDENWDDTDVNDYNPRLHLDNANVIRNPDGANRSERKLFIKKERKRLGDGDDSSDEDNESAISSRDNTRNQDEQESWSRKGRYTFPPNSVHTRKRSRSPINSNKSKRVRSRSPIDLNGSGDGSPYSRRFDYSRNNSLPSNSNFNSGQDPYYIRIGRHANNNQYNSGRDRSSIDDKPTYCDTNSDEDSAMPPTPPPPMISYPAPRSYIGKNQRNRFPNM